MDAFAGLTALGLTDLEAAVFAVVVKEHEVTAADLAAATSASQPAVSVAVKGLVRRGLVDRVYQRRPSLVFLAERALEALAVLVTAADERERERRERVEEAVALVELSAAARADRGRPRCELERYVRGEGHVRPSRQGRTAHDQVLSGQEALRSLAGLSLLRCPARLLLTGPAVDLEEIARRQASGSEVRATTESLPAVWLLDGDRVGVSSSTEQGGVIAWSRDKAHLAAATELFELWWERAGSGVVTPAPVRELEGDWDVEEWDCDECEGCDDCVERLDRMTGT